MPLSKPLPGLPLSLPLRVTGREGKQYGVIKERCKVEDTGAVTELVAGRWDAAVRETSTSTSTIATVRPLHYLLPNNFSASFSLESRI